MEIVYPAFGRIVVDGREFDHDVVIENGQVRARDKKPSKHLKARFGHTPLSADEDIPWLGSRLVVGSGHSGRLPVLPEVEEEAGRRGVDLFVMPTGAAVQFLTEGGEVNAILHVTC